MRTSAALGVFACAAMTLAYLTSEMLPIGLLPRIAASLHVSLPSAGLLLSAYALVVTIAGPPLTALAGGLPRKPLMLAIAAALVASTTLCAFAQTYAVFLAARLFNAVAHGIFWAIVASTAASLVAPERRGYALSIVYAGSSIGIILGVPFGTFVGERFGWHAAFLAVAAIAGAAFLTLLAVPSIPLGRPSALGDIGRLLRDGRFVRLLLTTTFLVAGTFTAFTYFTPLLQPAANRTTGGVPALLLADGVAGFASIFAFGLFSQRRNATAIVVSAGLVTVALACLAVDVRVAADVPATAIAIVALWGFGMSGAVVSLQARVLLVQPGEPDVASALNSSAFNLGIGGGAVIGGTVLNVAGLDALPIAGALLVVPAIALQLVPLAMRRFEERGAVG